MAYKIYVSTDAELDIDKAITYYKDIKLTLAKDFLKEVKATRKYITKNPEKLQIRYNTIRIAFLKQFPFGIHFKIQNDTIYILSVLHTSKNNEY